MSLHFTDQEFQDAWGELDEPRLEGGWELFVDTMGVKIYRLLDEVPSDIQPNRKFGRSRRRLPLRRFGQRCHRGVSALFSKINSLFRFNVMNNQSFVFL